MINFPRVRHTLYVLTGVVACSGIIAQTSAAQTRTALSWVREPGAEACIAAQELGRKVEQIVGPVLVAAPEGEISVEGRIARNNAGFMVDLTVVDATGRVTGRRQLRSTPADCRGFDDEIAFVIAVTIDPNAALAELPGELSELDDPGEELLEELQAQPPAARMAAGAHPAPAAAPVVFRARGSSRVGVSTSWSLGLGPMLGLAVLDGANAGGRAELGFRAGRWSHRLHAGLWLARAMGIDRGARVQLAMAQLGLSTCPQLWAAGTLTLALCGGATAALVSVEPSGFSGQPQASWIFGPSAEARLGWRVAPAWTASLGLGAQSLWPRQRFIYENGGRQREVLRLPPVMAVSQLAIELLF